MAISSTAREIISDCLERISRGDPCAMFDLAAQVMSHADSKDIGLNLAIVEALALMSKRSGCEPAEKFLASQWSAMKEVLRTRWARNGLIDSD